MPNDFLNGKAGHDSLVSATQRPQRMTLWRLWNSNDPDDKGEFLMAQFNPAELEETLKVDWAKHGAPGSTQKRHHYVGTENYGYSFELIFDALLAEYWEIGKSGEIQRSLEGGPRADLRQGLPSILKQRRQLQSFCFPRRGSTSMKDGEAPRILFFWPNLLSLTCVITDLHFKYERFNASGAPTYFNVKVQLEEIRDVRLHSEDVMADGTFRRNAYE
jgi:hypothetical protein